MAIDIEVIEEQILALVTDESEDVTLDDLTQEVLNGSGVFDTLMRAMSNHLEKEHSANRITGDQYATVYSAALTQVLQQSIAFLLGKGRFKLERGTTLLQLAKLDKEIALLCQKLVTEKAQVMNETVLDPTAADDATFVRFDYDDEGNAIPGSEQLFNSTIQPVEGVTGRKNDVLTRQEKGYDDDYKTKTARSVLDAYRTLAANSVPTNVPSILDGGIDYLLKTLKIDAKLQEFDPKDYLGANDEVDENADDPDYYWKLDPSQDSNE